MKTRTLLLVSVAPPQRCRGLGFTLFEFAVSMVIFATLVAVLLDRIWFYQQQAEQAGVRKLVANMQSALSNRLLAAQARGVPADRNALARENPISWLERTPGNYGGEGEHLTNKELPGGLWYFDRAQHRLIYVYSRKKSFREDSYERSYFKVEFLRLPTKYAKPEGTHDQDGGVALIQVDVS